MTWLNWFAVTEITSMVLVLTSIYYWILIATENIVELSSDGTSEDLFMIINDIISC